MLNGRTRELLLRIAFAVWGLAVAISLIAIFDRPATPDQLPGTARSQGFDAHGPFRWIAALMLLPILFPVIARPLIGLLTNARAWARNTVLIAPLVTLWLVTMHRVVFWTIVPCAIAIAVATLLRDRDLQWSRRDCVLVATFLPLLLALTDIRPGLSVDAAIYLCALLLLGIRIAITYIPSSLPPALAFIAAPLGLVLQTNFFGRDQRYFGWHALLIAIVTPFLLRVVLRNARRAAQILVLVTYPLALYGYANALSLATAEGKPRIDFFEDGHALQPASEYLRGELPYRDTQPAHGLLEDGLFDVAAMQFGEVNLGTRTKARMIIGGFVAIAMYAVAFAATGSAEGAFFAVLLAILTGELRNTIRFLPSMITLSLIAAAVRRRKPRLFLYAGIGVVLCGLTSLDFAAYTFLALIVAVIRSREAMKRAAIGIAAAAVPLFLTFALLGILDDFFRVTFVETLGAGTAYTLNFFTPPDALARLGAFPDVLAALLDRDPFLYLVWTFIAVFTAVMVTRRTSRRVAPLVILGTYVVATAISYAERHHIYFGMLAAIFFVALILHLLRRRQVALATLAIFAAIALAGPTTHIGVMGMMRRARAPLESNWSEIRDIPRARGALVSDTDAKVIRSAASYLARMPQNETFFDFTNSGTLYFLFDRDCPIREYEVAFYETEAAQREVIRRLQSNPNITAALVPATPHGRFTVDGVPNAERAPLVWRYLEENFHPDFAEGDVVFWRRN